MKNFVNKIFTIRELKKHASKEAIRQYNEFVAGLQIMQKYVDTIITNGRVNHYWFQKVIAILSSGEITVGGQGNSEPDLYWGTKTLELKGFTTGEFNNLKPIRTGASKFFASNGGITALKQSDQTLEAMKKIVFDSSYHDDYYMLTETCGMKSITNLEDIRIIFVETSVLTDNLISECGPHTKSYDHKWTDGNGKEQKKKINWPYLEVDTSSLCKKLEAINEQQC
jgi:hypothetical protein